MTRKLILALAAVIALAAPAAAAATQTVQFGGGLNCSVTAYTPSFGGSGALTYSGGVSCGGGQAGYQKRIALALWQLVSGGWQVAASGQFSSWQTVNPLRNAGGTGCVRGRWYATQAEAEVTGGGMDGVQFANTFNSGYQCT